MSWCFKQDRGLLLKLKLLNFGDLCMFLQGSFATSLLWMLPIISWNTYRRKLGIAHR